MRVPALICALLCMVPVAAYAAREKHLVRASAKIIGLDGHEMGVVKFAQSSHGVLIEIEVHGLTPGAHAVHIHSAGVCDVKRKFENAGPDFSPTPKLHGFFGKGGPHAGDLPNEYAGAGGTLHAAILAIGDFSRQRQEDTVRQGRRVDHRSRQRGRLHNPARGQFRRARGVRRD